MDVFNELENLKTKSGIGPDILLPIFLHVCRFVLFLPITFLFKAFLNNSCFSSIWKSTFMNQIFKKGDKSLTSNYRTILLL
ncbi:zinc finger protein 845-like [Aphis craccivora]|uniref:Zinc finger protein 845-like n=1 Tax=Aphis craccivora TaxID=307492 RepID=A0A6G0YD35_APHCR|nr:zinc finger protein 845-like [Aphis craccivora]